MISPDAPPGPPIEDAKTAFYAPEACALPALVEARCWQGYADADGARVILAGSLGDVGVRASLMARAPLILLVAAALIVLVVAWRA